MGQGSEFIDDSTEQNIQALEAAKQRTSTVESIASKGAQTAQISTSSSPVKGKK